MAHVCSPCTQDDGEFEANLKSYIKSSKPAWVRLWDYVLKTKTEKVIHALQVHFCFMCALWHQLPDNRSCIPNSDKLFRLSFQITPEWMIEMILGKGMTKMFPSCFSQPKIYSDFPLDCDLPTPVKKGDVDFLRILIYIACVPLFQDFFKHTLFKLTLAKVDSCDFSNYFPLNNSITWRLL